MIPALADLKTESDVEQKLIWPLLVGAFPEGLGFHPTDISTKLSLRRIEIGKGSARKIYFPDYIVVLAGFPVLIVEAKAVGVSIEEALDEARLYGQEVNALYPHNINPCVRVVACNGEHLWTAPLDTASPDITVPHSDMVATNISFARFVEACRRDTLQAQVDEIRRSHKPSTHSRPVNLIGGISFQDEELPQNTFGATIAGDYGHIFNPKTREDRAVIVREAYVPSLRRQRYIEPIDRLVRNAVAPTAAKIKPLDDSSKPEEIATTLRDRTRLENQIMLLVGSVGVGKSTFVDYLSLVALPPDLREKTVWLRINLNEAPVVADLAYTWLARGLVEEFREQFDTVDFDEMSVLEKVFAPEINALKKGPLSLLEAASEAYRIRLSDAIGALQADDLALAKGIARHLCAGPGRLLVVVLDNCDKRTRDEQLTMFQVATWLQRELRCLVVLPLRDVTFDLHRHQPPLDTVLKQLVFRIEPPAFPDVLQARARLALAAMSRGASDSDTLSFQLPNGMRVVYPAKDQALYLASMLRSLYAHDRFVRQVMTGLAGRDVRRALEIFLDFCTSGHIGEDEIYKIRFFEGKHVLPLSVVARVLLRMQRRFYDGDRSYLKNVVQCVPDDPLPDHFVRLGVLHWFAQRITIKGPAGVQGFHRTSDMVSALVSLGHEAQRVRAELLYLAREGCVVPEHLRPDSITDDDLVKITASGMVHIQLMTNPEYLAACAEDTYISDPGVVSRVASRLTKGLDSQFSRSTTALSAADLVAYLKDRAAARLDAPHVYLDQKRVTELRVLEEAEAALSAAESDLPDRLFVGNLPWDATLEQLRAALDGAGIHAEEITFPTEASTGRSRGYAFVRPADAKSTLRALEGTSVILQGRRLRIDEAHRSDEEQSRDARRDPPLAALSERLFIGNLSYSTGQSELRAAFESHGFAPICCRSPLLTPRSPISREQRDVKWPGMAAMATA